MTSLSNVSSNVVPVSGNFSPLLPPAGGNCRWNGLAMWADYTCGTPRHAVTENDLADGFFTPRTGWEVSGAGLETETFTFTGEEVDVIKRNPSLEATISDGHLTDVDGDGFASAGDVIGYEITATNNGNVRLTDVSGNAAITYQAEGSVDLAIGESAVDSFEYELTAADIAAAHVPVVVVELSAKNGARTASITTEGRSLDLEVAPGEVEPSENATAPTVPVTTVPSTPATTSAGDSGGKVAGEEQNTLANTGFNAAVLAVGGGLLLGLGALVLGRTSRRTRH